MHPVTNVWLVADISQRDPWPEGIVGGPAGLRFPDKMTSELQAWKERYTAQVDVVVKIKNTSSHEVRLFQEWNSWGYCNLKFVFDDGGHEYWVTKRPGLWYRNFPAWDTLTPGASILIPVAFADHIWDNVDQVRSNANQIASFRALYEQYNSGFSAWNGSVSSEFYPAADLLPRFGFRKSPHLEIGKRETDAGEIVMPAIPDPEDGKVIIK